jgi:hypothetical protein
MKVYTYNDGKNKNDSWEAWSDEVEESYLNRVTGPTKEEVVQKLIDKILFVAAELITHANKLKQFDIENIPQTTFDGNPLK